MLNPKLSFIFLAGAWNGVAVDVLVEGCGRGVRGVKDSLAGEQDSMDSSSMSSRSNESTRETSFVASATILKETSLMGVGTLGSFQGIGALGILLK